MGPQLKALGDKVLRAVAGLGGAIVQTIFALIIAGILMIVSTGADKTARSVSVRLAGEKDGPAVAYFENGQKEAEGMFRKGQFHGTWTGWYPDGTKRKVAEFVDGDRISVETFPDE